MTLLDNPVVARVARPQAAPLPSTSVREDARRARDRRRKIVRGLRYGLLTLVVAGALGGAVAALRPRPVPADVVRTSRGPLEVVVEESGVTRVKDRYVVSAPVTGNLSRLAFEAGDAVREGEPLAQIAPSPSPLLDARTRAEAEARLGAALSALGQAEAQIARVAASKELADQELARSRALSRTGSLAPQALDQAEFAARMQAAELSSAQFAGKVAAEQARIARVALGRDEGSARRDLHVEVQSPVSGRILRVLQKSEGVTVAGAPLVEVGDPSALEVVVDLLTTDAVRVSAGTPVTLEGWGGDAALQGRVRHVEPSAFTRPSALGVDEQRVNVIVALVDPKESRAVLGDGFHVEARIVLWRAESVVKVPHGAVFRHGEGWATFRFMDGTAKLTPVRVGHRGQTEVEIVAGLAADTPVVVHPGDRVKDGVRVEAR